MTTYNTQWIATVDRRHARLLSCRLAPGGRRHMDEHAHLENPEFNSHEHHRPMMLGRNPGGHGQPAANKRELEEERRRFARHAAAWLIRSAADHRIGEFHLFAPAHMLHDLGRTWPHDWQQRIAMHEAELTTIPASELAAHPAVIRALDRPGNSHAR